MSHYIMRLQYYNIQCSLTHHILVVHKTSQYIMIFVDCVILQRNIMYDICIYIYIYIYTCIERERER